MLDRSDKIQYKHTNDLPILLRKIIDIRDKYLLSPWKNENREEN